ncbi:hypothetical protein BDP81DRAFT_403272, partial [Colletotrichum phormii]
CCLTFRFLAFLARCVSGYSSLFYLHNSHSLPKTIRKVTSEPLPESLIRVLASCTSIDRCCCISTSNGILSFTAAANERRERRPDRHLCGFATCIPHVRPPLARPSPRPPFGLSFLART